MNRPIKFRAWISNPVNRGYVDPSSQGGVMFYQNDQYLGSFLRRSNTTASNKEHDSYVGPDDLILLQFTGLHDKNGKEIYEGDILQWTDGDMWKGVVEWSEGDADFLLDNPQASLGGFETNPTLNGLDGIRSRGYSVIGNIYENPELLTPKQ